MLFNKDRAMDVIDGCKVDALIASSLENVFYISDYWSLRLQLQCGAQAFALMPMKGQPALIAPLSEADLVMESGTWIDDVRFYGPPNVKISKADEASEETQRLAKLYREADSMDDALDALVQCIEERDLGRGVLALDTSRTSPKIFDAIQGKLPEAKLVDGGDLLREIRLIKTDEEVERIQRATEITEKSMEDALEIVRSQITEIDLASMFEYSVAYDSGKVTYNLIGFRERSAFPNPIPSTFEAHRGDVIRMTLGCTWQHYHSNISRTAVIGNVQASAKKRWEAVVEAQEDAFELVKPGARLSEIYAVADKRLNAAGLKQSSASFGHGIGLECNERPHVDGRADGELTEGMVINIDVPFLELGSSGFQVEDTALVTKNGYELLTRTDRSLYIL